MIDYDMEGVDDDDIEQAGDDSMQSSSEAHCTGESQHSEHDPPSVQELTDGEGGESKKLETEVQVRGYELAKAVLTTIRINDPLDDMAPALEYSISRDSDILELKVPPIKVTV